MSHFKVGDIVWFLVFTGSDSVGSVLENELEIQAIVIEPGYNLDYFNSDAAFYKSKQDCINAFKKRLDEL